MATNEHAINHTCEHCGGDMTYAPEHHGMASQCPHCQKDVVLGGHASGKMAANAMTHSPAQGRMKKIIAWVSCALLFLLLAIVAVVFVSKGKKPVPNQPTLVNSGVAVSAQDNETKTVSKEKSPLEADADDAVKFERATVEAKVWEDFETVDTQQKMLAKTTDAASALSLVITISPLYDRMIRGLSETSPTRDAIKQIKKDMLILFQDEKQWMDKIASAIHARDVKAYAALLKDEAIHQVETRQKIIEIDARFQSVLKAVNHPLARDNKLKCMQNVMAINAAKLSWATEKERADGAIPTDSDLLPFLKGNQMPVCPNNGKYTFGTMTNVIQCSVHSTDN